MKSPAHYQTLEFDRVRRLVGELVSGRPVPLRVLDYGFGQGKYLACFKSLGCAITAVDANPTYVGQAKALGFSACTPDEFFSCPDSTFDVLFLSHLIEHLPPDELSNLIPRLGARLANDGRLIIVTPTVGERFYHDFSHVRPYLPQSIRHAFGQIGAPLSYGESKLIELVDIYFFRDPYRTRTWRSFYVGGRARKTFTRWINAASDCLWRLTGGRIGVVASWLGVYRRYRE